MKITLTLNYDDYDKETDHAEAFAKLVSELIKALK